MANPRFDPSRNQYTRGAGTDDGQVYTANGAITIRDGIHALAKTSAAAMTLAPPTAADSGIRLAIVARTAFAHTVTITEGLGGAGATKDVITFAAVGDSIELLADNLHWVPLGAPNGATIG